jgi:hypothetical protein
MQQRKSRLQGSHSKTRFDNTQLRILQFVIAFMVTFAVAGIAVLVLDSRFPATQFVLRGGGPSRYTEVTPRYIDIWAVRPGDRLRFTTIFHPEGGFILTEDNVVTVAGPLVMREESVEQAEPLGAEIVESEFLAGPGSDSDYVYQLFKLEQSPESDSYGVDMMVADVPYISPIDETTRQLALGAPPQTFYEQVIVAVAFPRGTRILDITEMQPYRRVRVGGWVVYYFDTTTLLEQGAIRFQYRQPQDSPQAFDYEAVDASR